MKKHLLSGAAAAALVGGLSLGPAQAFDQVDWKWDLHIDEFISVTAGIVIDLDPASLAKIEGMQIMAGDAHSFAKVFGSSNVDPAGDIVIVGDSADFSGTAKWDHFGVGFPSGDFDVPTDADSVSGDLGSATLLDGSVNLGSQGFFVEDLEIEVSGTVDVSELDIEFDGLDAEDLPSVVANSTAFLNLQSVDTDTLTQVHQGQYAFGDFVDNSDIDIGNKGQVLWEVLATHATAEVFDDLSGDIGNTHIAMALGLLTAGSLDLIEKAEVSSGSVVAGVKNAQTSAVSTGFANAHLTTLEPMEAGDRFLIQDLTQFAYADVSSYAVNYANNIYNYGNLGALEGNLHEAVSTAAGNISTVSISGVMNND